jgi:hypothetical protein
VLLLIDCVPRLERRRCHHARSRIISDLA